MARTETTPTVVLEDALASYIRYTQRSPACAEEINEIDGNTATVIVRVDGRTFSITVNRED